MSFRSEPVKDIPKQKPKTAAEAIRDIRETFKSQPMGGWDKRDQQVYLEGLGLEPKRLEAYTPEEIKTILRDLVKSRMVLYRKN